MATALRLILTLLTVVGLWDGRSEGAEKTTQNAPEWVVNGSNTFSGQQGKFYYGVGSASGITNPSLLRIVSENRARAALAKEMKTVILKKFRIVEHWQNSATGELFSLARVNVE